MNSMTVLDRTLPVTFRVAPSTNLATELHQMTVTADFQRLPEIVAHEYPWYASEHKWAALAYAEALEIATQMQFAQQASLNAQQVLHWLTKDMADRTYALARYRMGYDGEIACRYFATVPSQTFRELVTTEGDRRIEWVFVPIEQFAKLIPFHALQAVKMLADEGIMPDAFWVADKIEIVIPRSTSRSVDPILLARFGKWLVGIAMWL